MFRKKLIFIYHFFCSVTTAEGINVLAHAWGPGHDPKNLAGDVHFDEDDDWKNYNALLGVAVHELGHVMGLGHSTDDTSIMYPVYRADVIELGQDDINGIKEVYGRSLQPYNIWHTFLFIMYL